MQDYRTIDLHSLYAASLFVLLVGFVFILGIDRAGAGTRLGANYFPNVPLVNQDGNTLHFYNDVIKGKVVAINFIYTDCSDSCPMETAKMRRVYELLGDHVGRDVFMYSISIDPEHDTPAMLRMYMKKFKIGPNWQFLTGNKKDINLIRTRLGMYREEEPGQPEDLTQHIVNLIVGNEVTGQWLKRTPYDTPHVLVNVLRDQLHNYSLPPSAGKQSYAMAKRLPNINRGEDLFNSRCRACHTIGRGDELGPDLAGVVEKRDRAWLVRWLKEPDAMLREKDPLATALFERYRKLPMPNLKLTEVDVKALIEYMQKMSERLAVAAGN